MSYDMYRDDPEVVMYQMIKKERCEAEQLMEKIKQNCDELRDILDRLKGDLS